MSQNTRRVIILGAAGRDFHDFNVLWRDRDDAKVVCFTAAQIPDIDGRLYPPVLAGPRYPQGIPIHAEADLPELIAKYDADTCVLAYSDLSYETVMHKSALVMSAGADFLLVSPAHTQLVSKKPVVAVVAVRTGCGKSQTTRYIGQILKGMGLRVAAVRHPMPYGGDLTKQVFERFTCLEDLDKYECTIEEREEYEPHILAGNLLFAGVDYSRILEAAEAEADVILWDGGNNDVPFFKPTLCVTVTDPHRAGHETSYYPSEVNLRLADVVVVNKMDTADAAQCAKLLENVKRVNPKATVVEAESPLTVEDPALVRGKRVLCIEDGPTVTHGEMGFGAASVAARQLGAAEIVDPRPYAVGSIAATFAKYPHLCDVLPAMGYGAKQISELEQTVNRVPCDMVLIGTPIDLGRLITIDKAHVRVRYELAERHPGQLKAALCDVLSRQPAPR